MRLNNSQPAKAKSKSNCQKNLKMNNLQPAKDRSESNCQKNTWDGMTHMLPKPDHNQNQIVKTLETWQLTP